MKIRLDVSIVDSEMFIKFEDNQGEIQIADVINKQFDNNTPIIYLLLAENEVKYIGKIEDNILQKKQNFDKSISIILPPEVDLEYLKYTFIEEAKKSEIKLINKETSIEPIISKKLKLGTSEFKDKIIFVLEKFGYEIFGIKNNVKSIEKSSFTKTRHKWSKEISQIKFTAKSKDGEGSVIWKSKNELVLLSGAKLVENPQLNKDGSINFSAQFAQKLRSDHLDKIADNKTTVDIVFQSPNQLGIFLFYGSQNTWAELKDSNGKSLDEWSKVD